MTSEFTPTVLSDHHYTMLYRTLFVGYHYPKLQSSVLFHFVLAFAVWSLGLFVLLFLRIEVVRK